MENELPELPELLIERPFRYRIPRSAIEQFLRGETIFTGLKVVS